MSDEKQAAREIVVIVTPDEVERDKLTSILHDAGYVVQYATYETLVRGDIPSDLKLIILDADQTVAPDPIPALSALYADEDTKNVPVLLLIAAYGEYDVSAWFDMLQKRRIVTFRKDYTQEHILWFIRRYLAALSGYESSQSHITSEPSDTQQ